MGVGCPGPFISRPEDVFLWSYQPWPGSLVKLVRASFFLGGGIILEWGSLFFFSELKDVLQFF